MVNGISCIRGLWILGEVELSEQDLNSSKYLRNFLEQSLLRIILWQIKKSRVCCGIKQEDVSETRHDHMALCLVNNYVLQQIVLHDFSLQSQLFSL